MKTRLRTLKTKGFALVATLSLMILLTLIAVGLLTLSTVTVRSSGREEAMATARANARLGMMMALGELQRLAGADQRVTATASIMEKPDSSGNVTSPVANPHWTGVWYTDRNKGDTASNPFITRLTTGDAAHINSLTDRRANGSYNKSQEVLEWLVSRPDPSSVVDPATALTADNGNTNVTLVGDGSLGTTAAPTDKVTAPVVPLQQNGKRSGGYAWWVGDEGVKARLDLAPGGSNQAKIKSLHADHFGISAINTLADFDKVPKEELPRIISRNTAERAGNAAVTKDAVRAAFHSITSYSDGVLADTLNGGLKRDLTAFLNNGTLGAYGTRRITSSPSSPLLRPNITTTTPLIDPIPNAADSLDKLSAKMGLLKNWYDLGKSVTGGAIDIMPPAKIDSVFRYYDRKEGIPYGPFPGPSITNYNTASVHPVIVDAGMSYGLSIKQDSNNPTYYQIYVLFYPRFILWNPYNVTLNASSYAVQIGLSTELQPKVWNDGTTKKLYRITGQEAPQQNAYEWFSDPASPYRFVGNTSSNPPGAPTFYIPSTSFEPGESLLFTADAGSAPDRAVIWTASGSLGQYPLSCSVPGNRILQNCFALPTNRYVKVEANENVNNYRFSIDLGIWGNQQTKNLFSRLWKTNNSNASDRPIDISSNAMPLQLVNMTENGYTASDIPGSYNVPSKQIELLQLNQPGSRQPFPWRKHGQRVQWFVDTPANKDPITAATSTGLAAIPFLDHNMFSGANLRADWNVRCPAEFALRIQGAGGSSNYARYVHGPFIDDLLGWDWSVYPPASASNGKNRVSPFGNPTDFGDMIYPVFDLPQSGLPLLSLGALQHVPVSNFYWHPSYAIGNGQADMRVARNRTVNFISSNQWLDLGFSRPVDAWLLNRQNLNDQSFLYDLSYEANFALWDRYFLSTIPSSYAAGTTIPNSRMSPLGTASSTITALKDGNQAASRLMLKGAFNINSTSEAAWTAWLGSMRENPAMQVFLNDGSSTQANNAFSRLLWPHKEEYQQDDESKQSTWSGYRKLTDPEIKQLAKQIVAEVKRRGPFISLADFVNRRLTDPPSNSGSETDLSATGLKGTLQAAIDRTDINKKLKERFPIAKVEYVPQANHKQKAYGNTYPDLRWAAMSGTVGAVNLGIKPDHNHLPGSKLTGAPGYLTQADLLQKLGSSISARSDTFVIRAYGESRDASGAILAQAWAECVVQRTPEPIKPDQNTNNLDPEPPTNPGDPDFGRRFQIVSFRWLTSNEI